MELRVGGKYRFGRKIDHGCHGDVYLVTDIITKRQYAMKLESVRPGKAGEVSCL